MHCLDVGVIQLGQCQGFLAELLARSFIGDRSGRKNFQSDISIELLVVCAIDFAHATSADLLDNTIMAELVANHEECTASWRRILGWAQRQVNLRGGWLLRTAKA